MNWKALATIGLGVGTTIAAFLIPPVVVAGALVSPTTFLLPVGTGLMGLGLRRPGDPKPEKQVKNAK